MVLLDVVVTFFYCYLVTTFHVDWLLLLYIFHHASMIDTAIKYILLLQMASTTHFSICSLLANGENGEVEGVEAYIL